MATVYAAPWQSILSDRAVRDSKLSSNARNDGFDLALNTLRLKAQHAIPRSNEHRITRGIRARALLMIGAIDLDHEPPSGREKVSDEAPEKRHLASKHDAQATAANASPKELLRSRERETHLPGARIEQCDSTFACAAEQGLVVGSSHAPTGAGGVPAPAESRRARLGWRVACALSHDSNRQRARAVAPMVKLPHAVPESPTQANSARRGVVEMPSAARGGFAPRPALRATGARRPEAAEHARPNRDAPRGSSHSPLNFTDPSGFSAEEWETGLALGVPYTAGLVATLWTSGVFSGAAAAGGEVAAAAAPAASEFVGAATSFADVAGPAAAGATAVTSVVHTALDTARQPVHQYKTNQTPNRAAHARSVARGKTNESGVSPTQEPTATATAEPVTDPANNEQTLSEELGAVPPGGGDLVAEEGSSDECLFNCHARHPNMRLPGNDVLGRENPNVWRMAEREGEGAARRGGLFLRGSRGGFRLHGDIPNKATLAEKASAELVELREMTQTSIATREAEMLKLGAKGAHANRLGEERRLLDTIMELLRGRGVR